MVTPHSTRIGHLFVGFIYRNCGGKYVEVALKIVHGHFTQYILDTFPRGWYCFPPRLAVYLTY